MADPLPISFSLFCGLQTDMELIPSYTVIGTISRVAKCAKEAKRIRHFL